MSDLLLLSCVCCLNYIIQVSSAEATYNHQPSTHSFDSMFALHKWWAKCFGVVAWLWCGGDFLGDMANTKHTSEGSVIRRDLMKHVDSEQKGISENVRARCLG